MSPSESGGAPAVRSAVFGDSIVASTMRSATWIASLRNSAAAACVSARVANAPAAHGPRFGIARRDEPPVTCTSVPPPLSRSARAPVDRNANACSATATVQPRIPSSVPSAIGPPPHGWPGPGRLAVTALTMASSEPCSERVRSIACARSVGFDASASMASAPRSRTRASVSSLRATAAPLQPCARKWSRIAPPRLRAPRTRIVGMARIIADTGHPFDSARGRVPDRRRPADHRGMVAALTRTLAALATASALVAAPAAASAADGAPDAAALERAGVQDIVVQRAADLDRAERAAVRADAGVQLAQTLSLPDTEVVRAAPGRLTAALAALDADPSVVYAEPDAPVHATTDARFAEQWSLRNTGQRILGQTGVADADIDAPEAWSLGATGAGVTVAVVDTGVNLTHPDLVARIATNPGETGAGREANGIDDDHDGHIDDWRGWDWVAGDNDPSDENGHGTHVSGTIAAAQDAVGVSGVAPDARILPLRVLDATGSGSSSAVAAAFDLAGRMGIPVVNASLGSSGMSTVQRNAIQAHPNTLYVVAAGNDGHDNELTPTYPCVLPLANVVCVGATDNRDVRASFSNVGTTSVDLFAPGVSVLSSYKTGYTYMSGTSMATPHVAATLALMRQAAPALDSAQLKQDLLDAAERKANLADLSVTGGRLDAEAAIQGVRSIAGLPPVAAYDPVPAAPAPATPAPSAPTPSPAPAPVKPTPSPVTPLPLPSPSPSPAKPRTAPSPPAPRLHRLVAAPATAIVCRTGAAGCHPRPARLSFSATSAATVTAQVQRRACTGSGSGSGSGCTYRTAATVKVAAAAGTTRLAIGTGKTAHVAPGAYRVRLVATARGATSAPV